MSKKQNPSAPAEIPNTKPSPEIEPVEPSEIDDSPNDEPEIEPFESPDIDPMEPEIPGMPSDPSPEIAPSTPPPARPM